MNVIKWLLIALIFLPATSWAAPVLFYSDITSGPNTGGQNNAGVFVRVFGKGFGASMGSSTVTVGGAQAAAYLTWSDNEVSFQLGPNAQTGNIVVTTGGASSNGLPFTVRQGRIFFANINSPNNPGSGTYEDPWRSPKSFYDNAQPGDTLYMRTGTYAGEYGYPGWGAVFGLRAGTGAGRTRSGTQDMPVAYLAYPGEKVILSAPGPTGVVRAFRMVANSTSEEMIHWTVIGNFYMETHGPCILGGGIVGIYGKGWRIVNNDCLGLTSTTAVQSGSIVPGGDFSRVLGNKIHGGRTGNKLDHAVYSQACGEEVEIAWNNIYDNNFDTGPLVSINYEGTRCDFDGYAGNIYVHDNIVDATGYPCRCLYSYDQSYTAGDPVVPVTYAYNNIFINCGGPGTAGALLIRNGGLEAYNNSFYNTRTYCLEMSGPTPQIAYLNFKNNICHMRSTALAYASHEPNAPVRDVAKNIYFGLGNYNGTMDTFPINADPQYADPANGIYSLMTGSPGIDSGISVNIVSKDFDGVQRPQGVAYGIGAFEFVSGSNTAPTAADDSVATTQDTPVVIDALLNDSDADGDALAVINLSAPANGTAALNSDQTITYTPAAGFTGTDSFTYNAYDGKAASSLATVTVSVNSNNGLVARDDAYATGEDTPLTVAAPGVLANDTISGTNPRAEVVIGPVNGNVTVNADGSFQYGPFANYNGQDSFTYRIVTDGSSSAPASVSLTINAVNDPPVSNDDAAVTISAPVVINLLANDTDIEGDSLSITGINGPQNGIVTINQDNSVTYTPGSGFYGTDSFTYRAFDGAAQGNAATVTITVKFRPVAVDDSYATNANTPLPVPAPGVLGNYSVIAGAAATIVSNAANGSLVLNSDGSFIYTPALNFAGTDSFTYKVAVDGVESNIAAVAITVMQLNRAPVAYQDRATTPFNTAVVIPVLANDIDPDGDPLSVAGITTPPSHGVVVINPDKTVTYTPNAGFKGTDRFYYTATDGTAVSNTARITVSVKANKKPVAVQDYATTTVNTPVVIDIAANDYDTDGTVVKSSVIVLTTPGRGGSVVNNHDGTVTFTPATGFTGSDYFYYNIQDNYGEISKSAKVTVKVAQ